MANNKKGMSPVAAGVIGGVVGAAVGAGAAALSDEKNRKALGKTVKNLTEEGARTLNTLKEKSKEVEANAQKKLAEAKRKVASAKK